MISKLVAHYWACILFCRRWLGAPGSQPETIHRRAVARIVECLPPSPPKQSRQEQQQQQDKGALIRFAWPVFMAAIETTDPARRDALMARLAGARDASAECEWSWAAAREIVGLQMRAGEGAGKGDSADGIVCWVDLAWFMQMPPCPTTMTTTSVVVDGK